MLRLSKTALAIGAALLLNGGMAMAQTTISDSNGFEAPDYTTGNASFPTGTLEFQQGWQPDLSGGTSTAIVQSAIVKDGSQAVRVDRTANSADRWGIPVTGYPTPGFDEIILEWDMRVEETTDPSTFGPLFGGEAYDRTNPGFGQLASLLVDSKTGDVLYQQSGTGGLVETGTQVSFGVWNSYKIVLDYGTDTYDVFLNDVSLLLSPEGFIDIGEGLDKFTDANIATVQGFGDPDSLSATGTAYFDNFVVSEVPEPSSLALLALGTTLMLRRRH